MPRKIPLRLAASTTAIWFTYEMEGSAYELTKVADGTNEAGGDSVVSDTSNGKFVADKKITVGGKSYRVSSDAVVYIQYQETGSNDVKYRANDWRRAE